VKLKEQEFQEEIEISLLNQNSLQNMFKEMKLLKCLKNMVENLFPKDLLMENS
jgi:hypothetical protein